MREAEVQGQPEPHGETSPTNPTKTTPNGDREPGQRAGDGGGGGGEVGGRVSNSLIHGNSTSLEKTDRNFRHSQLQLNTVKTAHLRTQQLNKLPARDKGMTEGHSRTKWLKPGRGKPRLPVAKPRGPRGQGSFFRALCANGLDSSKERPGTADDLSDAR